MPSVSNGVFWSAVERYTSQLVLFVLNIIIARILAPSDYGLVGMLAIFIQICQCLIDGGLSNALIQKIDRSEKDYSTVFIFNIVVSLLLYAALYISAPYIAVFYNIAKLGPILRILGLNIIISSFSGVYKVLFTIKIDFKTQSYISVLAAFVSGIVGIVAAYGGYGVWALVIETLLNSLIISVLFCLCNKTSFGLGFSISSLKLLGGYGLKLMFASLINTIYNNLYALFIGKKYSAAELGYYSRADQFVSYASSNMAFVLSRVSFPIFCKQQNDVPALAESYKKFLRLSCYVIFPLMVGLAVLSKPIVILLLKEKWLAVVPLMCILCIDGMYAPINHINLSLLQAVGRSDLFLKLEILKKIIGFTILLLVIPYGIYAICIGRVVYGLLALNINMYYTVNIIKRNYYHQFKDWFDILVLALSMGIVVHIGCMFIHNYFLQLLIGVPLGVSVYILFSYVFKLKELSYFINLLCKRSQI